MSDLQLLSAYEGPALSTPNRVVMAPMTRNRAGESRVANTMMATYYAQRATAGLLVTESIDVSPQAIGYPGTPGLYTTDMVEGWRGVVQAVRAAQPTAAPFFAQLFHTGRVSHTSLRPDGSAPVAPSPIPAGLQLYTPSGMQDASPPRALETDEIASVVGAYVAAARGAVEAGFDGVEINAGNGYLVEQFLRDGTNQRTDRYGGSVPNRLRFLVELVDALSDAIGSECVAVRVSPGNATNHCTDSDPETLYTALAASLEGRGLAYLHVVESAADPTITARMRAGFSGTLIANSGYDKALAEAAIASGATDLVSFGTAFLANPDLPHRLAEGASLNEADPATFYGGTEVGYTDYPTLGG